MFKVVQSATNFVFAAQASTIAVQIIPRWSPLFFMRPSYFVMVHERLLKEERLALTKRLAEEALKPQSEANASVISTLSERLANFK